MNGIVLIHKLALLCIHVIVKQGRKRLAVLETAALDSNKIFIF